MDEEAVGIDFGKYVHWHQDLLETGPSATYTGDSQRNCVSISKPLALINPGLQESSDRAVAE